MLTTSTELNTARFIILRGKVLDNGGTMIKEVCDFPSGGSPYTCNDEIVGNNYRALEIEYSGDLIAYEAVIPK
jgi:hypothetical protein